MSKEQQIRKALAVSRLSASFGITLAQFVADMLSANATAKEMEIMNRVGVELRQAIKTACKLCPPAQVEQGVAVPRKEMS